MNTSSEGEYGGGAGFVNLNKYCDSASTHLIRL